MGGVSGVLQYDHLYKDDQEVSLMVAVLRVCCLGRHFAALFGG